MSITALPLKYKDWHYLPATTEVVEGEESVTLKVKVTKKGAKLKWFKDGKELKVMSD